MKRTILMAAALIAAGGIAGAASAQAVKPPMSPELQKIVDSAKTEKVLLSSTNPLVFGGQANLDAAKAWIKENFGVDLELNFTNGGPFGIIGAKISTEFRANQPSSVDIWTAGIAQYDPLLKLNMFTQVPWQKLWPERIVPQQIGADGYSLGISTGTPGVLYNVSSGADFAQVQLALRPVGQLERDLTGDVAPSPLQRLLGGRVVRVQALTQERHLRQGLVAAARAFGAR